MGDRGRQGWPLPYIPDGKANWEAFVHQAATPEPLEQAALSLAVDALLAGWVEDTLELLREVLAARDGREFRRAIPSR